MAEEGMIDAPGLRLERNHNQEEAQEDDPSEEGSVDSDDEDEDEEEVYGSNGETERELRELILPADDRRRMLLTEEEWHWAMGVKEAIESSTELGNLSDFMYAHLGLICKSNVEEAVQRAELLQAFREEYLVRDTYQDGCAYLRQMIVLGPRHFLDFSYCAQEGTFVFVHDSSRVDTSAFGTSLTNSRAWMAGAYYLLTCFGPDFDSIRKGVIVLNECEGWSWKKKQDFRAFHKIFSELMAGYPFRGQIRCYNAGVVLGVMTSMLTALLPESSKGIFRTGYTSENRLDQFYLMPDETTANQRIFLRMTKSLQRRYELERSFSLLVAPLYRGSRHH